MGMQGIDGKFALLKMAQTHLCVKWKELTDNENYSADERYFLAYGNQFAVAKLYN